MRRIWHLVLTGTVVAVLSSAGRAEIAVPVVLKAEPASEWDAKFAGKEGWIGGDGVYSVELDRRRILWLFGDTLLGTVKDGGRRGAAMVNNTAAIQDGRDAKAALRFVSGPTREGKPAALFTPADGKGWFWPQAAFRVRDRLFVFLSQIDKGKGKSVLAFKHVGQWLLAIDNPDDAPAKWRVKQHRLPFAVFEAGRVRSWGSAVVAEGGNLYVYGFAEKGKEIGGRKLTLAKVTEEKVTDFASWRFRTADGWSAKAEDASPLADGLATEFSVSRGPGGRGFVAVYTENGLGDRIVARFAAAPAGPWSRPLLLFRCPEMTRDKGVFCYAAKAHSWAAADEEMLVSYCVNTWEFARLFREEKVYRPKFVRVKLKLAEK